MNKLVVNIMVVSTIACFAYRSAAQDTPYAPLEVFTNGRGRVSPLGAGQALETWQAYTMLATPESGSAFYNWEYVDVLIQTTRTTNDAGVVVTNVQKTVTSKDQFLTDPKLVFTARPVVVTIHNDQLTTTSAYGWRANFGPVREPVEPDVYRTIPGTVVEERGDRLPTGSRTMPISATLTFDYSTTPPSLTAVIRNAVLEGGAPFPLTVRSHYAYQGTNGTFRFSGDYLRDLDPTGSQYGFDWDFSTLAHGTVVWNGAAYWGGGHVWHLSFSNLALLPQAQLRLGRVGATAVQASWRTNFSDHVLESASAVPTDRWSIATNLPTTTATRSSVTLEMETPRRFYRLRKP
jgi:hypothetical protein